MCPSRSPSRSPNIAAIVASVLPGGTVTTAVFPNGVSAPVQYGPRITAWVTYLLHAQFIPEKRVAEVMSDLFAVKLSTATITAMGRRTARRFEGFLDRLAEIIRTAAPVKHLDETGIRIAARTQWLHVLCTRCSPSCASPPGAATSTRSSTASSSMTTTPPTSLSRACATGPATPITCVNSRP